MPFCLPNMALAKPKMVSLPDTALLFSDHRDDG